MLVAMSESSPPTHPALRALAWPLAMALLVLFFGSQTIALNVMSGTTFRLERVFLPALFQWSAWALLAPLVFLAARRLPIERPHRARNLALHGAVALAVTAMHITLFHWALATLGFPARRIALSTFALYQVHADLVTYGVLVGIHHAREWYLRYRDREVRAAQMESRLAQARLEGLRMQLQPHFLFNTLHAISALMHRDVEAADRMLARLSDLLRLTLESAQTPEVPLRQELEFLDAYLEIQQTRFQDRLEIARDVDPRALDALVPNLLLQPLVENAIRHGIGTRAAGGRIEIAARLEGDRLRLDVRDDGPGLNGHGSPGTGVGLANTRARLEHLYGAEHELSVANDPAGGLRVTVIAPYREARACARRRVPCACSSSTTSR
jgi:signal transduction histidine kinase